MPSEYLVEIMSNIGEVVSKVDNPYGHAGESRRSQIEAAIILIRQGNVSKGRQILKKSGYYYTRDIDWQTLTKRYVDESVTKEKPAESNHLVNSVYAVVSIVDTLKSAGMKPESIDTAVQEIIKNFPNNLKNSATILCRRLLEFYSPNQSRQQLYAPSH